MSAGGDDDGLKLFGGEAVSKDVAGPAVEGVKVVLCVLEQESMEHGESGGGI